MTDRWLTRVYYFILFSVLALGAWGLSGQHTTAKDRYDRKLSVQALRGSYASTGRADGYASRSVGVIQFDGRGNLSRFVRINSSDGTGGRRLLDLSSIGTYTVDPDGFGVMMMTNTLPGGGTSSVTYDFVIKQTTGSRSDGALVAYEVSAVQREAGLTASLIEETFTLREGL